MAPEAHSRPPRATGVAALTLLLLVPHGAWAYVRATAEPTGLPTFWPSSCELVTIYTNGYTGMSADEIAKSVAAAARAWGPEVVTCPDSADAGVASGHPSFEIITQLASGGPVPDTTVPDGQNTIVFSTDRWDHPAAARAVTLRHPDRSGRIFDADIEINTLGDTLWANLDPGAPPPMHAQERFDLQEVLTHEFGHFLGLAHTCFDAGAGSFADDDQAQEGPACSGAPAEKGAVMWYEVTRESVDKRVLTTDDARGVCAIYPPQGAAPACPLNRPDDGCGCRIAGDGPRIGPALLALAALLRRRRRRLGRLDRSA